MKKNNEILDKALDTLFEESSKSILETEGTDIEVKKVEFSPEHNKNMKKLFRAERRKERIRSLPHALRVASIVLVVILLISGTIYSVEALRNKFLNFMFDSDAPDTAIEFKDDKQEELYKERVDLGYIPDGFELAENEVSKRDVFLEFKNPPEYFQLKVSKLRTNGAVNTEDGSAENITVNNYEGIFLKNENENSLLWHDSAYTYVISSNIEKSEIIKIAENIKAK